MQYLEQVLTNVVGAVPSIIYAIVLLILAWIVASIVKAIVIKVCKRFNVGKLFGNHSEKEADGSEKNDLIETLGKTAFVIVFVLFLPGILDNLNLQGVSQPITNMMNTLFAYIPNVIGAGAIFFIGMSIAKIIKQITVSVLQRLNFDKLQEKAGIKPDKSTISFSALVGTVIYSLILIFVTTAALQILNISSVSVPAINMLNIILSMIPNVFVAIFLIAAGVFIGKLAGSLVSTVLSGLGINSLMSSVTNGGKIGNKIPLSKLIGDIVKYIIILLLVVQSLSVLHLEVLNSLGTMIVVYLPNFISALIIFGVGLFLASFAEKNMNEYIHNSVVSSKLVKYAIIIITVFMTLNQLKIASLIVNTTFIAVLCTAAVATAISFGIGGRDAAANVLQKASDVFNKKDDGKAKK